MQMTLFAQDVSLETAAPPVVHDEWQLGVEEFLAAFD